MSVTTDRRDRYLLLDAIAGWREAGRTQISPTGDDGILTLDLLPGRGRLFLEEEIQNEAFLCPSALAADGRGKLLVTDAAANRIRQIDLATHRIETIRSVGGEGSDARQLKQPRGVAGLASGAMIVSDTGNHRIQIFSPGALSLLRVMEGAPQMRWPWAVAADPCGVIFVADRGNHRVRQFARDGTSLPDIGGKSLRAPIRLALGPDRTLAVVDAANPAVLLFSPGQPEPTVLHTPDATPLSAAFDAEGKLYVGDAIGLIHVFAPDAKATGGYRLLGAGDTAVSGEIIDLAWVKSEGLLAIIHENSNGRRQRIWRVDPAASVARKGEFITELLDSRIERCQWHRVSLRAKVPPGTSLQLDSYTAEKATSVAAIPKDGWKQCLFAGDDDPDGLVQSGPGQYLRLRLTFFSNDRESPSVRSLKAFFPRTSYLQYLPAVYQEDEQSRHFLDRFLSIFQTDFDEFDRRIDRLWELFDPNAVPEKHFAWLASWLALDLAPEWTAEKKRQMLKNALRDYRRRGTVAGLEQVIADYAGVSQVKVLEHFRLRRWPTLSGTPLDGATPLWSRDFYQRLQETSYSRVGDFRLASRPDPAPEARDWGAHKFTVFFPADPYSVEDIEGRVARIVEKEKPAHTMATLCPVLPRLRVGVQATVGFDTVVGGFTHLVLGRLGTLGYDTILPCSPAENAMRVLGSVPRPRAGLTTRLS